MSQKFCTSCGAELEPGQKFCTSCGASIGSSVDTSGVDKVIADETAPISAVSASTTTEMNPVQPQAYTPDTTGVMPRVDEAARSYRVDSTPAPQPASAPAPVQDDNGKARTILITVICVLAVVLLILVGVIAFNSCSADDSSGKAATEQTTSDKESSSSSNSSNSSSSDSSSSSASEQDVYTNLSTCYSNLSSYDTQIANVATTFNNNYLKGTKSTRQSYADTANELQSKIDAEYAQVKSLNVSSSSPNYSAYQDILTCYDDCSHRISVICQAWSNSLSYSDPSGHSDAICAPLAADNVGNKNKYKSDFDSRYPSITLTKPSS